MFVFHLLCIINLVLLHVLYKFGIDSTLMNLNDNAELKTLLDGITDGVVILGGDWDIRFANMAFRQITGLGKVVGVYSSFRDVMQAVDGLDISLQLREAQQEQRKTSFEVHLPRRKSWLSVFIHPAPEHTMIYFQDVTIKKQHVERVFLDEQNLRVLFDIIAQPVWLVDPSCRIQMCNEAFRKWISYFVGKPLLKDDDVLDPSLPQVYLDKFRMCYELALSGKTFTTVEDMVVGGEMKFSTISFNPVFNPDGKLTGVSCHASDITDQRRTLSRIDAQTQLLMEIASIQSHKVRGPVATLLGLVKVFDKDDLTNPDNVEVLLGIESVTMSLDTIVRDVIRNINRLNKHTRTFR